MIGPYKLIKTIGVGAYAKVKLGQDVLTGDLVAIKVINKGRIVRNGGDLQEIRREIAVQKLIRHPNVLRLIDIYETNQNLYIVLEYAENGELFDYIVQRGVLSEGEVLMFFQQIIFSLEYCHSLLIAHRDLKPENILLDGSFYVKIADFGLAKLVTNNDGSQRLFESFCGSPHYAAPEVLRGENYEGRFIDIWACGVILYALINGFLPFDDTNPDRLLHKVQIGKYKNTRWMTPLQRDLVSKMLVVDPAKRITIDEIKSHPWFTKNFVNDFILPSPFQMFDLPKPIDDVSPDTVGVLVDLGWGDRGTILDRLSADTPNLFKVFYYLYTENLADTSAKREHKWKKRKKRVASLLDNPKISTLGNGSGGTLKHADISMQDVLELKRQVMSQNDVDLVRAAERFSKTNRCQDGDRPAVESSDINAAGSVPRKLRISVERIKGMTAHSGRGIFLGTPRFHRKVKKLDYEKTPRSELDSGELTQWKYSKDDGSGGGGAKLKKKGLLKILRSQGLTNVEILSDRVQSKVPFGLLEAGYSIQFALNVMRFTWIYPNLSTFRAIRDKLEIGIVINPLKGHGKPIDFVRTYWSGGLASDDPGTRGRGKEAFFNRVTIIWEEGEAEEFLNVAETLLKLILL